MNELYVYFFGIELNLIVISNNLFYKSKSDVRCSRRGWRTQFFSWTRIFIFPRLKISLLGKAANCYKVSFAKKLLKIMKF